MRRRILAIVLCICMATAGFVYAVADGDLTGDANGDGKVTSADAAFVMRYCVGLEAARMTVRCKMRADVDHNGAVNEQDAVRILRHIVELETIDPIQTDAGLLALLNQQSLLYDDDLTEWTAQVIQSLPEGDVRKVLFAGAQYLGTPYGTNTGQMDCSKFVSTAFKDAGIPKTVYPQRNSDGTLVWFRNNHPELLHETDQDSWQDWKPGCVLIYVNTSTNKGSHLALYVGEIDGEPIVMESRRSGCDGVRLGYLMGSGSDWDLQYYVDPLG